MILPNTPSDHRPHLPSQTLTVAFAMVGLLLVWLAAAGNSYSYWGSEDTAAIDRSVRFEDTLVLVLFGLWIFPRIAIAISLERFRTSFPRIVTINITLLAIVTAWLLLQLLAPHGPSDVYIISIACTVNVILAMLDFILYRRLRSSAAS